MSAFHTHTEKYFSNLICNIFKGLKFFTLDHLVFHALMCLANGSELSFRALIVLRERRQLAKTKKPLLELCHT